MPNSSSEVTQVVSCGGGLDIISDPITLFNKPSFATILTNFESAQTGGYRRIDGYSKAVATTPTGSLTPCLGIGRHSEGLIVAQGTGIYKTTNFTSWTSLGITRTNQSRNVVTIYRNSLSRTQMMFSDGVNNVLSLDITGSTLSGAIITSTTLGTSTGCPSKPQWATMYKERYVVAQDSVVYWSGRFTPNDFTTSSAGAVDVGDVVTGLKSFRDILYVFCRNSIHAITDIDENPQRQQVAKNIGCISGWSVQEVNGDILFLAKDGLRTIAATDKIGDVELSTVSHPIQPLMEDLCISINEFDIASVVIRNKNQYRLFYNASVNATAGQRGIIGSVVLTPESGLRWEWSETKGIEVVSISSEEDLNDIEKIYHGDYDGYIYHHTSGTSFDGSPVKATYKTPDLSFGDSGIRKTLYSVKLSIKPEKLTDLKMTLRYDFSEKGLTQPQTYNITDISPAAIYGKGIYSESVYGANTNPLIKCNVEGSGSSCSFKFETNDTTSLYRINGFYVDLQPNGRMD